MPPPNRVRTRGPVSPEEAQHLINQVFDLFREDYNGRLVQTIYDSSVDRRVFWTAAKRAVGDVWRWPFFGPYTPATYAISKHLRYRARFELASSSFGLHAI